MQYDIYKYNLSKFIIRNDHPAKYLIQYGFKVNCLNKNCSLNYLLNFYKYKSYLYITDFFPAVWENDENCFRRLTSTEGLTINIRKTVITCLLIFHERIRPMNHDSAMVISGSYLDGEKPDPEFKISRKLKLYWNIFKPLALDLNLKIVELLDLNAVILIDRNTKYTDAEIRADYLEFKN